jgi:hypothetical protein
LPTSTIPCCSGPQALIALPDRLRAASFMPGTRGNGLSLVARAALLGAKTRCSHHASEKRFAETDCVAGLVGFELRYRQDENPPEFTR